MKDLVTVIVPVYNVEDYISKCANSIFSQTYKNLEIIFVDDGSTDSSGKICDSFKMDKRVEVVHKKNGGLSSARNTGLQYMHGKFVTFIDSDDWIDPKFIETLYHNLISTHSQISSVGYYIAYENKAPYSYFKNDKSKKIMDKKEALSTFLLHDGMGVTVWGKLYEATLWNTIRCPEGKLHEDQYTTYKLLNLANRIVFDKTPLYYYYQRPTSIGHAKFSSKSYDLYYGIQEEYNFIINNYPDIMDQAKLERDVWELVFVNMMLKANTMNKKIVSVVRKNVIEDLKLIYKSKHLDKKRKIEFYLFSINFNLYKNIYKRYISQNGVN